MILTRARDLAVVFAGIAIGIMCVDDILENPIGRRLRGLR